MRNAKGHWMPGTSGNPGGRVRDRAKYLDVVKKTLTFAKWKKIVNKAITDAIAGDRHARTWVSDYVLGKPIQFEVMPEQEEELSDELQRALERISGRRAEDGESSESD